MWSLEPRRKDSQGNVLAFNLNLLLLSVDKFLFKMKVINTSAAFKDVVIIDFEETFAHYFTCSSTTIANLSVHPQIFLQTFRLSHICWAPWFLMIFPFKVPIFCRRCSCSHGMVVPGSPRRDPGRPVARRGGWSPLCGRGAGRLRGSFGGTRGQGYWRYWR